jgi:hypothetical protein
MQVRDFGTRVIIAICLMGIFAPVFTQTQLGSIIGRVTDASEAVVPAATVSAVFPVTGATFTTQTNAEGYYVIANLQYGRYNVTVAKPGFASYRVDNVDVASSTATTLDARLAVSLLR